MRQTIRKISRHSFGIRNLSPWRTIIAHTFHEFHLNDLFTSAAAMSYFGLLALFPALLLLLALGQQITAGSTLLAQIIQTYPGSTDFLNNTLGALTEISPGIIISCIVVVLWAGSWVFTVIENALNRIWGTVSRPILRGRAVTLAMMAIVGAILLVSVLVTSVLISLQRLASQLPQPVLDHFRFLAVSGSPFWQLLFAFASITVTVTLFIVVFKFLPNAPVTLHDALPGAIAGGILWELSKYVFAWTLHYFHYDQIYGPVGAVVAVLTWSYVSSLVLLFGAQLTAVCHRELPAEEAEASASAGAARLPYSPS